MTRPIHDLVVTSDDGTQVGYYIYTKAETPIEVDLTKANLAANVISDQPGRTGGYYTVRDQDQPAIVYSDWTQGAGQKTFEVDDSLSSKFHSSSYIDTQAKGELRLARSVTLADDTDVEGVVINALGKVFCSFTPAVSDPRDSIRYWDGAAWQAVPFTGTDPTTGVSCFATDGQYIYAACGGTDGVWRVTDSDADGSFLDESFAEWDTAADADGIQAMTYSGGYLYAAKNDSVGYFDATPTWQQLSPAILEPVSASFGLAAADNWVYWGTTVDGFTRVTRTQYDGTNEWFEDVCSFPTGFIGTHMAGYLGNVYVGGYYECATSSVGQGAIYVIIDGTPHLLTLIGENPDYTAVPTSTDNDNRVWWLTLSGKDLYILTTRRVLRWDLDDGGWVQVCDVPQGTTSSMAWLTTGDLDYTGAAVPDAGTWTASGTATASASDGVLILTCSNTSKTYTATLSSLDSATGTTMQVVLPANAVTGNSGTNATFGFDDGTHACRVRANFSDSSTMSIALGEYVDSAWVYYIPYAFDITAAHTVRLTCASGVARLYADDTYLTGTTNLATSAAEGVFFSGTSTVAATVKYDSLYISDDGAFAPGSEYAASTMGGIAVRDSKLHVGINSVGYVISDDTYETEGWLRESDSSSKSGSMSKRYHTLRICHDALRDGEGISADWYLDGAFTGGGDGTTDDTVTTFDVDATGHSFAPVITLTSDGTTTPIIRSIIVTFDFEKPISHTFVLDCRTGSESGRWAYDPETAIGHLISVGQEGGMFETHFAGTFRGVVESVRFLQAQRSVRGFLEGIVQIKVREL